MNKLFVLAAMMIISMPAIAVAPVGRGRASMANQMESRAAVTKKYIADTVKVEQTDDVSGDAETQKPADDDVVADLREREKAACIQNNIGIGATFVWASKYSDTSNYNLMIEDVEFPENNVCFVKVDVKSNDSRIDVSDVPAKYFVVGEDITCGSWVDKEDLKIRILDAKKKGRTWATIGGAVGGAGVGVGAMELFGNELIGKSVEGQAAIEDETELRCAQMKELKEKESDTYHEIVKELNTLKVKCNGSDRAECKKYDYDKLLQC